jgi:hypothetical protein
MSKSLSLPKIHLRQHYIDLRDHKLDKNVQATLVATKIGLYQSVL